MEGVGHQALQLGGAHGAALLLPHSGEDEGVVSTHTEGNDHCQDVHEGEEGESEDDGVSEIRQTQGVRYGSETRNSDGEAGCEAPDGEEDDHESKQEVTCIFNQIGIEQSIFQT